MANTSLLNVSDLASGAVGVALNALALDRKIGARNATMAFGSHAGVSIVSRMLNAPGLSGQVAANNQQYLFAGVGGAFLAGGKFQRMLTGAAVYAGSAWAGDMLAVQVLGGERELLPLGGVAAGGN